jgi:hypothetical protein
VQFFIGQRVRFAKWSASRKFSSREANVGEYLNKEGEVVAPEDNVIGDYKKKVVVVRMDDGQALGLYEDENRAYL